MVLVSVILFAIEIIFINILKNSDTSNVTLDNDVLHHLVETIKKTDLNYYVMYIMIYASFVYLGIFYTFLLHVIILMQGFSVSIMAYLTYQLKR